MTGPREGQTGEARPRVLVTEAGARCGYCGEYAHEFYSFNPDAKPDLCGACLDAADRLPQPPAPPSVGDATPEARCPKCRAQREPVNNWDEAAFCDMAKGHPGPTHAQLLPWPESWPVEPSAPPAALPPIPDGHKRLCEWCDSAMRPDIPWCPACHLWPSVEPVKNPLVTLPLVTTSTAPAPRLAPPCSRCDRVIGGGESYTLVQFGGLRPSLIGCAQCVEAGLASPSVVAAPRLCECGHTAYPDHSHGNESSCHVPGCRCTHYRVAPSVVPEAGAGDDLDREGIRAQLVIGDYGGKAWKGKLLDSVFAALDAATRRAEAAGLDDDARLLLVAANAYGGHWTDRDDAYWLARLMQEVGELASALVGDHDDPPEHELKQVGSIALNWLRLRSSRAALAPSRAVPTEDRT